MVSASIMIKFIFLLLAIAITFSDKAGWTRNIMVVSPSSSATGNGCLGRIPPTLKETLR